jgi:hypothetical protein
MNGTAVRTTASRSAGLTEPGSDTRTTITSVAELPTLRSVLLPQGQTWPRPADLLDSDGAFLTAVEVTGPPEDGIWPLGEAAEPSVLLTYIFGRGQHAVMLDLGVVQVTGWLATRWDGDHRGWWLEPDEELTAA